LSPATVVQLPLNAVAARDLQDLNLEIEMTLAVCHLEGLQRQEDQSLLLTDTVWLLVETTKETITTLTIKLKEMQMVFCAKANLLVFMNWCSNKLLGVKHSWQIMHFSRDRSTSMKTL
jgi:hypothetical protein